MSRYYTDDDVAALKQPILDNFHPPTNAKPSWHIRPDEMARAVLDTVARRMVCNAAADALEGALHLVDDDDSAETLARLADQWRIEAGHVDPS